MSEHRERADATSGHGLMRPQAMQARILPEWFKPRQPSLLKRWLMPLPTAGLVVFAVCVFTLEHEQWRPIRAAMAPVTRADAAGVAPSHCGPSHPQGLRLRFLVDAKEAARGPELAVRADRPDAEPPQPVTVACRIEGDGRRTLWVRSSAPLEKDQRYLLLTKDRRPIADWMFDKSRRGAGH